MSEEQTGQSCLADLTGADDSDNTVTFQKRKKHIDFMISFNHGNKLTLKSELCQLNFQCDL